MKNWTDMTEAIPPSINERYLCYDEGGLIQVCEWGFDFDAKTWIWFHQNDIIIHWRSLPGPPEVK